MSDTSWPAQTIVRSSALGLLVLALLISAGRVGAQAKAAFNADEVMVPMEQLGPQARPFDARPYAKVIHVGPNINPIATALASIKDASATKRYAILVEAGVYQECRVQMKPYVDLYGGFDDGDWKNRKIYDNATILDGQKKGPVVLGADHARLDGFFITGGEHKGHGGGIVCDGVSPTIVNNILIGNNTLRILIKEGLGKQVGNEGGAIALLNGSRAYVANNLICQNTTETGSGGGISLRGRADAKILRNVFCNNIAGVKDDQMYHGRVGTRSSPGAAVAIAEGSSPHVSFNVMVMGEAALNNDAGGVWVEGNSMPLISYNWIVGNLSGDDGGGIYVMGANFYDEAGKRHDAAPDGPVNIEGNLIAGNDTVRGGPGGVRVSRFGRVNLWRNRIVANAKGGAHGAEGGVICIQEGNVIKDNGPKRKPATPTFRLTGEISGSKFDPRRYVTEIATRLPQTKEGYAGSVVRIGTKWSVVKASGAAGVVVWGKIEEKSSRIELLDQYVSGK